MNYFEFYPGDYLRDTSRLRLIEHGAYLRLLLAYYSEEEPLPGPVEDLYIICAATTPQEKQAVQRVADRFFPAGEDGLRRKGRVEQEIAKARKRIETARSNGAKHKGKGTRQVTQGDTQPVTQRATRQLTHSGEALPHATRQTPPIAPDTPTRADTSLRAEELARALREMGWADCSAGSPDLIEAAIAGVTAAGIRDAAAGKADKGVAYIARRAIGRLLDARGAAQATAAGPPPAPAESPEAARLREIDQQVRAICNDCEVLELFDAHERDRRLRPLLAEAESLAGGATEAAR